MSDNIDIPVTASGDEGVDRITSAIDRLTESMTRLGENSAVSRLASQMELMQATMATGFAAMAATSEKLIENMGARQVAAVDSAGTKTAAAMEAAGFKLAAADARTWEQISKGSSSNVTKAFFALSQGIPVEQVEARLGQMATATAAGLDKSLEALRQYQENAKSLYTTAFKPMAGATEAQLQEAAAMNARVDAQSAAQHQALVEKRDLDEYHARSAASAQLQTLIEKRDTDEYRARSAAASELQALIEKRDTEEYATRSAANAQLQAIIEKRDMEEYSTRAANTAQLQALIEKRDVEEYATRSAASVQLRALVEKRDTEEYAARSAAAAQMQSLIEKRDMEEYAAAQAATQRMIDIEQRRDTEMYALRSAAAAQMAEIQQRRDMEEYTAAQAAAAQMIAIEQKRDLELHNMRASASADASAQAERQRALNTSYLTSSPASQVQTATQAQVYAGMGGDAQAKYGSAAAGANALTEAQARLTLSSRETAAAQLELGGALGQVEGAFRGAAHEAGIYGMHHGQLIGLLAGGAVAAALHHIAETGAEVEFQLASLSAFSGDMAPVNIDKFVSITAGTMTNLKDAAEGVHALAAAGRTQQEAFKELPDVMRLAALGEMSVAQAAEMAVESMHAFHDSGKDIGEIGDILTAVGTKSNVSIHTLAEDMKSAAVTGELFGLTMEEITATVGALAERGLTIQPLSSALNKLYEPSAKTAKAMEKLGLSTKDLGTGELKEYTTFMSELAAKVNQFQVPADVLKQLGMSPQSIKAMEVMTQHLDEYKHLLHEAEDASGKMFEATMIKANTTTGAYEILGSTVQGSMVKAFGAAEPIIRQVEEDLLSIARSSDTQEFLSGLATGFASLTRDIIENRSTIGALVAGYVGMRVAVPVLEAVAAANTFLLGGVVASTAAVETQAVVVAADTVQLDLFAVAETGAAIGAGELGAAAAVSTTVIEGMAVAVRVGLSVLGPLALVLGGAAIAFDLFHGSMSKGEADRAKMNTSIDSTIGSMETEIKRLQTLQEELDKTGRTGAESAYKVQLAFAQMQDANAKAALDAAKSKSKGASLPIAGDDGTLSVFESNEAAGDAADAEKAYSTAHDRLTRLQADKEKLASLQTADKADKQIHKLDGRVERLPEAFEGLEAANPKLAASLKSRVEDLTHVTITQSNYNDVLERTTALEKEISGGKLRVAPVASTKPNTDAVRAEIDANKELLALYKQNTEADMYSLRQQNKRGEIGDLTLLIGLQKDQNDLDLYAVSIAEKDLVVAQKAAAVSGKKDGVVKAQGALRTAQNTVGIDNDKYDEQIETMFSKMSNTELSWKAKTLSDQGALVDAYNVEWEAKNGDTLDKINSDIENSTDLLYQDRLAKYKQTLIEMRDAGAAAALFKMDSQQFDADLAKMKAALAELANHSGAGTGLGSLIGSAFDQRDTISSSLPKLIEDQKNMVASAPDDKSHTDAVNKLKELQAQAAAMNNIFVSLGDTIAKSLTDAFGKGGTALGGLVTASIAYDAKMKDIQSTLADSDGGDGAKKKAAQDTASAQIKSYADMAGAAKGFFDVNSNGYRIMQSAEKAFHVLQLVDGAKVMLEKIGFKTAETTATVTQNAIAVGSEEAMTATSVVNAGSQASAWGVTAVAKAIASLPFPANLAAGAATLAAIAGLGIAIAGSFGGGDTTSADRQAAQGAGTVLGDGSAKSDSINSAIKLSAANSSTQINYLSGMLSALQVIQTNITAFASHLVASTDVTGAKSTNLNTSNGLASTVGTAGLATGGALLGLTGAAWTAAAGTGMAASALASLGAAAGPAGAALGAVVGVVASKIPAVAKLMTSIFGGKQTLTDSGFSVASTSVGSALQNGVKASSYADITTSGGWFSSDKKGTQSTPLDAAANQQFTAIISSMATSITTAAGLLGVSGDSFTSKLNSFVIDIGKVSLKGLTGTALTDAISSVFSKLGDQMAQAAIPDLTQFQQVGEGYLTTLARVATDYAKVDASLQSIGMTFGAVGVSSIAARENLISLAGGIDQFQSETADFATNFLTKAQQLAPVKAYVDQAMSALGYSGVATREQFASIVQGLDLSSAAGEQTYATLMSLESAFAAVTPAIVDITKSAQDIADERSDLQDQLDSATMTSEQLNAKAVAALDSTNVALYNQVQAAKNAASALDLQGQVYAANGDAAGAAAVLLLQHNAALAQTDPSLRALTQQLWDLQAAAASAATHSALLDLESQIAGLTGDKAAAAAILMEQHAIALAKLDPALRGATQNLWDLQAAATAASTVKSDAAALMSNVDAAYSTLSDVVQREKDLLQKRIDTETDVVTQLNSLGSSITSALASYDTPTDAVANRKDAQGTLASSLALMQSGGSLTDDQVTKLEDAMTTATKDSKGQFSSYEDYTFDQLKTQRQLQQLSTVTKGQETNAQKQLDALKAQSTALDDQLAAAKQQVDLLKGIDTSAITMAQALSSLQLALASAHANPQAAASSAITDAYQTSLGRAPDSAGLSYWQDAAASGTSIDDIKSSIAGSTEATLDKLYQSVLGRAPDAAGLAYWTKVFGSTMDASETAAFVKSAKPELAGKIPGYAGGGDFGGGVRLVGEVGPEIETTGASRIHSTQSLINAMRSPAGADTAADTARMVAIYSKMQMSLDRIDAATRVTAAATADMAKRLRRVIPNDSLIVSQYVPAEPLPA